jgi:adenylate cyclase class 2
MISGSSKNEVEVKLSVKDAAAFYRRLSQLRARQIRPRTHERNTIYDTPGKDLMHRGQLIRIRTEREAAPGISKKRSAGRALLTFKGPAQDSPGQRTGSRRHYKIRSESEVVVSDPSSVETVLSALGLKPSFRYEKFRTTYSLPGVARLKVEFDQTPIGNFLELEGPPSAIDRAAMLLGYTRPNYIQSTYSVLYRDACRQRRLKPANMLYRPTGKQPKHSLSA